MGQFSAGQQALIKQLAGTATIPGTAIITGTLPFLAAVPGAFATGAQGTQGATAFSWGNHALAGYATTTSSQRHDVLTAAGGETSLILADAPSGVVLVLATIGGVVSVWRDPADFTIAGSTLTFGALGAGDLLDVSYIVQV